MTQNPLTAPGAATLTDGRQSIAALEIARGTSRCLLAHGFARVSEVTLANGRRADLVAISQTGRIWIVEIKSSLSDFRSDEKWPEYLNYCDQFYFAVGREFPLAALPGDAGLILADAYGGEIVRPDADRAIPAARRKEVTLRFARAAALRLHALSDPDASILG
jgi:hypothetical protein